LLKTVSHLAAFVAGILLTTGAISLDRYFGRVSEREAALLKAHRKQIKTKLDLIAQWVDSRYRLKNFDDSEFIKFSENAAVRCTLGPHHGLPGTEAPTSINVAPQNAVKVYACRDSDEALSKLSFTHVSVLLIFIDALDNISGIQIRDEMIK